jgi:hypothetical protein
MDHRKQASFVRALVCVWLGAALILWSGCGKHDDGKPGGADASASSSGGGHPIVFKVSPEDFAKEFMSNQQATQEKYHTGVIELTGTVAEVGANMAGDSVVSLQAGSQKDQYGDLPVVQCVTTDPEPWGKLAKGQQATLRGDAGYLPLAPNLKDCEIVPAGPTIALAVPSFQLAAEYGTEREKSKKLYQGKNLIVSGKVIEKKEDVAGAITLFLEGTAGIRVRCDFGMIESIIKKVVPAVQVGQKVQVFGEIEDFNKTADEVPVTSCRLITKVIPCRSEDK